MKCIRGNCPGSPPWSALGHSSGSRMFALPPRAVVADGLTNGRLVPIADITLFDERRKPLVAYYVLRRAVEALVNL